MKEEQITMNYEAPRVKVIEVEVEKGFAVSDPKTMSYDDWD